MRTALTYTMSRVILFVVVLLLLDLAGARGLLLIALALLISGLLSYVLLSRQRDAMAGSLSQRLLGRNRANSFRARLDEGSRAEDTDDPEPAAAGPEPSAGPVSPADNR
jgi:Zn-dependent protease with chaperone function